MSQTISQLRQRSPIPKHGWSRELEDVRGELAITGVGESEYSGASGRDNRQMALEAIEKAIADAGLKPSDVDGLMVTAHVADQIDEADFHRYFGTSHKLWLSHEGGAMTWAATSAHEAALAMRAGLCRHVINVFAVDWASRRVDGRGTPGDYHASEPGKAQFEIPFGWYPQPLYFASFAHRHMHEYGTTEADLGELACTFRQHANGHPGAVMHEKTLTLEQYLQKPNLCTPFRKEDCCLVSDGAAAVLYSHRDAWPDTAKVPVTVEGVGYGSIDSAPYISQHPDITTTPQAYAAPWAYAMADINAADIDVIGVYDCFSGTCMMQIEDMGFCDKGAGGELIRGGGLHYSRPKGKDGIPCNTHGGLMSHAYVLGIAHVVELVRQLRGEAHNQVGNAKVAAYAGFTAAEASTLILRTAS